MLSFLFGFSLKSIIDDDNHSVFTSADTAAVRFIPYATTTHHAHISVSVHNYVLCAMRRPRSDKSVKIQCHALSAQSLTKKHFSVYVVSFSPPPPPPLYSGIKKRRNHRRRKDGRANKTAPPPPPPFFAQGRLDPPLKHLMASI